MSPDPSREDFRLELFERKELKRRSLSVATRTVSMPSLLPEEVDLTKKEHTGESGFPPGENGIHH
jgi:hypothetical protein